MSLIPHDHRLTAGITADLLDQGAAVAALSRALAAGAAVAAVVGAAAGERILAVGGALSLLSAVPAAVLALRVGLDAALFRRLAEERDLARFDGSMVALGLVPAHRGGRDLLSRSRGARRLLVLQGASVAAQIVLLAGAAVWTAV